MSPPPLEDNPTDSSNTAAELDLDWLAIDDDEAIQWASTPHKYSMIPGLAIGIPLSLVLIGIPIIVASYLEYTNTNYVVTNKGLYSKRGILSRDVKQIGFDKVQNISYSQSAIGSSLGYGSVDMSTAGGAGVELQFRNIPEPGAVQELIAREIDSRQQAGTSGESAPDDVLDEILVELQAIRSAVVDDKGGLDTSPTADRSNDPTTTGESTVETQEQGDS